MISLSREPHANTEEILEHSISHGSTVQAKRTESIGDTFLDHGCPGVFSI